ncbi:Aldo-keto reductase dtxS3 [Colletotrichum gloeosporioides]|uniref:Aldo-keto reductase dtxS3 n=1 Tax=Colletotrichum gloeosporioides TaxID=474922 RepID=A0A8H4CBW8_COLGL|nr:Aldo-keto reductase dtxS3 [Colletotrichum gloeosporioides]KAF3800999.1 Aldo-keto reductase dtxS3 [Colletotrichum gloeosporioides]
MPVEKSKDYQNMFGLSRAAIFNAVDASLRRLDTAYIDVLQVHRFDPDVPIEETMKALDDLVRIGKVRYIGASNLHGWTKFISMQNCYNLVYREEEREMIRYCNDTGIGLIPWSPLCKGCLTRLPSTADRSMSKREEFESKFGLALGRVEPDTSIISRVAEVAEGFTTVEKMDDTLEASGKILDEGDEEYLEALYKPKVVYGHS